MANILARYLAPPCFPLLPSSTATVTGRPTQKVVLFVGDQLPSSCGISEDTLHFQDPAVQLSLLRTKFPDYDGYYVVGPESLHGDGFAVYSQFLHNWTVMGEPLGYPCTPPGKAVGALLRCISEEIREEMISLSSSEGNTKTYSDVVMTDVSQQQQQQQQHLEGATCTSGSGGIVGGVDLVGFSKGGVVLNQLLAELSGGPSEAKKSLPPPSSSVSTSNQHVLESSSVFWSDRERNERGNSNNNDNSKSGENDPMLNYARGRIRRVYYVDAGLNARGVFLTDYPILQRLKTMMKHPEFSIHLFGTYRQWGDPRRPWIDMERKTFFFGLQRAGIPSSMSYLRKRSSLAVKGDALLQHMRALTDFPVVTSSMEKEAFVGE